MGGGEKRRWVREECSFSLVDFSGVNGFCAGRGTPQVWVLMTSTRHIPLVTCRCVASCSVKEGWWGGRSHDGMQRNGRETGGD